MKTSTILMLTGVIINWLPMEVHAAINLTTISVGAADGDSGDGGFTKPHFASGLVSEVNGRWPIEIGEEANYAIASARARTKSVAVGATAIVGSGGFANASARAETRSIITPEADDDVAGLHVVITSVNVSGELFGEGTDLNLLFGRISFTILVNDEVVLNKRGDIFFSPTLGSIATEVPSGRIPFSYEVTPGEPYELKMIATANAQVVPRFRTEGRGSMFSLFDKTITWGGIDRVVNAATGEEITNYTMFDSDGVDWRTAAVQASPVPEPSSLTLASLALACGCLPWWKRRRTCAYAAS